MNKQQLDERLEQALDHILDAAGSYYEGEAYVDLDAEYSEAWKGVRQLITDVLDEVVPEKLPEKAPSRLIHIGFNQAITTITDKRRELGL